MADNLGKRPSKGILKNSSSFDKPEVSSKKAKETKWDEMNIIATLHPADKDYGHMKIDEPPTPYNYSQDNLAGNKDELDASALARKIESGGSKPPKFMAESESDSEGQDDADLTPEEKARRKSFMAKRKQHYNEYYATKLNKKKDVESDDESEGTEIMDVEKSPGSSKSPSPQPFISFKRGCPNSNCVVGKGKTSSPKK